MSRPVTAILGTGPGNGLAFARRFHEEGHTVALTARSAERMQAYAAEFEHAAGYGLDVTDSASVTGTVQKIEADLGPIDTLIYNAGSGAWGTVDDLAPADLTANMDINAAGLMRAAQAVLPGFRARGGGNLIVIGAGAATRGRAGTLAFAAGKAAQRSVAQSLARHLGKERIHVAYVIIDGAIYLEATRARMPEASEEDFLKPEAIADAVWTLRSQHPSAWTFELDVRPFKETW